MIFLFQEFERITYKTMKQIEFDATWSTPTLYVRETRFESVVIIVTGKLC